jgi:predicted MPP superfamily phosphohydrolase
MWIYGFLLTAGLLVGHVAITVTTLNVFYGQGWMPRAGLRGVRVLHDFFLFIGTPVLAWLSVQSGLLTSATWSGWPPLVTAYGILAVFTGWTVVPFVMLLRWTRRLPQAQLSNHGHVIDIAGRLGRLPIGKGPGRIMVHWPFNDQFQLEVLERTYRMPRLPAAWDGLSVLHISDLHFTGTVTFDYFEQVIEEARQLDCDIVAFTGDLIDRPCGYDWVPQLMGRLRGRHGSYAVLGNHDSWRDHDRIRRDLTSVGYTMLSGRWELTELRGHPLLIAGTEVPWMGRLPEMAAAPRDAFRILLSHTPDNGHWASQNGFDLMMSGHNHGGQVRVPIVGPVFMPSRFGCRYDMGAFQIGGTLVHVSRGVSGKHPYRLRCKPELTKLVLRSESQ